MSVVTTIFGDLTFGNKGQLQEFLSNHYQAHIDLNAYVLQNRGISLPNVELSRGPDHQWFADHWLLHKTLDQLLEVPGNPGLSMEWGNPAAFNYWHLVNNNAHIAYAQATGVE